MLPRDIALGAVGDHYIKGWDKTDEKRLKNAHMEITKTRMSEKKAVDTLNDFNLEDL